MLPWHFEQRYFSRSERLMKKVLVMTSMVSLDSTHPIFVIEAPQSSQLGHLAKSMCFLWIGNAW